MTLLSYRSPLTLITWLLSGTLALCSPVWAQLRIGQPSGFTGSVAAGVKENTAGANLYFDAVNARGGILGKKIELVSVDDKFDPKLTVELARKLVTEDHVLALFLNRGTPHALALLPLLEELKVPLVGPSTGAMALHDPVNPWVFNVRATYQREAAEAIEHLARVGITRIAVLQTDDAFGADGAIGAQQGFVKIKQTPLLLEKFPREKPDFTALAAQLGLRDALEGMDNYNLGGISVSYSATNHSGLDFADISIVNTDGKFLR